MLSSGILYYVAVKQTNSRLLFGRCHRPRYTLGRGHYYFLFLYYLQNNSLVTMSVVGVDIGLQNSVIAAAGRGGVDVVLNGNSQRLNP